MGTTLQAGIRSRVWFPETSQKYSVGQNAEDGDHAGKSGLERRSDCFATVTLHMATAISNSDKKFVSAAVGMAEKSGDR